MNVATAVMAIIFLLAPSRAYVRSDEPVEIRFTASQSADAVKMRDLMGLKAVELPNLFAPTPVADLVDQSGLPEFQVYTFDSQGAGKALEPKAVTKIDLSKGVVDVALFFPQIRQPGTYILTWRSAQPLVIETLRNPVAWAFVNDQSKPAAQRQQILAQSRQGPPAITHIVPLACALISTDQGDMKATFDYAAAPHTVDNFVSLASDKFYDGSNFHRIIKGFMIQGGDSLGNNSDLAGTGGPGYNVGAEISDKPHVRGVLSMARMGFSLDSAGSQFFIIHGKADHLNGQYSAFGQLISGLDVLDKIADTPVSGTNGTVVGPKPKILSIKILPATPDMYGIKK